MTISLPTAGDAWGIPGPTFLAIFVAAAAVVVIGSTVHRAWLFARRRSPGDDRLGPVEAAYLNGGDRLAVYTSLGGLRGAGAIGTGPDKLLAATGPMPAGATGLDQAVYNAAGKRLRVRDLQRDPWVVGALGDLRRGLEERSPVLGPAHLSPTQAPASGTYGAAGAAMGVALFGTASLWALDPAFAAQAEIQRNYASASSGGYSDGGGHGDSDSGDGSSCGGGGCGG